MPTRPRRRSTGPTATVVGQVLDRDEHECQMCGRHLAGGHRGVHFSLHHRRPRRMGGSRDPQANSPANLVVLCGTGATDCHGRVESHREDAYDLGLLLRADEHPAEVPVCTPTGVWLYDDKGGRHPFEEASA